MVIGVILGTLVVVSRVSWPFAWLGLELNLMCFVPLAIGDETLKKRSMFYFVRQRIGSLAILARGILSDYIVTLSVLLIFSIVLKMGAIPFHFWVPNVVPMLNKPMFYVIQTWQKVAPISLIAFIILAKDILRVLNVWVASATMLSLSRPIFVVIFSGMVQIGWIFRLSGYLLVWFVLMYFLILTPVIKYMQVNSREFLMSLVNAGGLPPFTGFIMKLKALKILATKIAVALLAGRGVALSSYTRMLLNSTFRKTALTGLLSFALLVGAV